MEKQFFVYMLASRKYGALYVGVTSNLIGRTYLHHEDVLPGQSSRYHIHNLVYFEEHGSAETAITRESRSRSGAGPGRLN